MTNSIDIVRNVIERLQTFDKAVDGLLQEKADLRSKIEKLKSENADLKDKIKVAVSKTAEYLKELEEIRTYYVSRNDNN